MMQTRSGFSYPKPELEVSAVKAKRRREDLGFRDLGFKDCRSFRRKKLRTTAPAVAGVNFFDGLPDDLLLCVLCKLSSSAGCLSDLVNIFMTCKRFNGLGVNPMVLAKASAKSLAVRAKTWSEQAHRFLKRCADAGNLDACYILGMIKFYCLQNRGSGASLMAKAAIGSHAVALYALAVVQFNGSGGCKNDKDLRAGVALCARSAFLGHVDALRELGHHLQDGYGVRQNIAEGRRFLVEANAREHAAVLPSVTCWPNRHVTGVVTRSHCPLLSDFGYNVPAPEVHPANRFLVEWFELNRVGSDCDGLRLCSYTGCGRPETRRHEFRRCAVCGLVNYCSRACQALHWKYEHMNECRPMDRWVEDPGHVDAPQAGGDVN